MGAGCRLKLWIQCTSYSVLRTYPRNLPVRQALGRRTHPPSSRPPLSIHLPPLDDQQTYSASPYFVLQAAHAPPASSRPIPCGVPSPLSLSRPPARAAGPVARPCVPVASAGGPRRSKIGISSRAHLQGRRRASPALGKCNREGLTGDRSFGESATIQKSAGMKGELVALRMACASDPRDRFWHGGLPCHAFAMPHTHANRRMALPVAVGRGPCW